MARRDDIVGALNVLRSAGIDIVGNGRGSQLDSRDFGAGFDDDDYDDIVNGDDDDDEISGADIIGAIVGASQGRRLNNKEKRAMKKLAKVQAKKASRGEANILAAALSKANKPGVRTDEDFVLRGLTLGMGSVAVAGPGVGTLTARAQEALRIQRIELDPNGGSFANFFVTSIIVGVRPQSANIQEMPLIAFSFNATGSYLRGNTVDRGQDFIINLRNGTVTAVTVTGVVFGDSLQP